MKTMILAFIFGVDLVGVDDPGSECVSILQAEARRLALCAMSPIVRSWSAWGMQDQVFERSNVTGGCGVFE
jgi:hypothetical protein